MARKRPENRNAAARRVMRETNYGRAATASKGVGDVVEVEPAPPPKYRFTEGNGNASAHIERQEAEGWELMSMHIDPRSSAGSRWWVFVWKRGPNVTD